MRLFKHTLIAFSFLFIAGIYAQENEVANDSIDYKYREDQFYASITYDLLGNKPSGISQTGFSSGFHFGAIRDIPLNDKRNFGFGIGLGVSLNSINQNLFISTDNQNNFIYARASSDQFTKNKFTLQLIEAPIEIRWRTSTPTDYNFWRIYTGIKLGYAVIAESKYEGQPADVKLDILDALNRFQYGLTLSVGYGAVNAHLYYGLSSVFKDSEQLNGEPIEFNVIRIGLMAYLF